MTFIRTIAPDGATGPIADVYKAATQRAGSVAHIIRIMSLDGRSAGSSMSFYSVLMKSDNPLPRPQREMLATVVSQINDCFY